jgi:hypothetical protein
MFYELISEAYIGITTFQKDCLDMYLFLQTCFISTSTPLIALHFEKLNMIDFTKSVLYRLCLALTPRALNRPIHF